MICYYQNAKTTWQAGILYPAKIALKAPSTWTFSDISHTKRYCLTYTL